MTAVVVDLLCICIIIISSSGHRTGEEWFYTKNTYHSLQTVHNERPCFLLEYSLNFCIQVVVVVLFFFLTSYATFTYADFLSPASLVEVVKQGTMSALLDWEWEFHKKVGMSRYWKAHFLQENCSLKLQVQVYWSHTRSSAFDSPYILYIKKWECGPVAPSAPHDIYLFAENIIWTFILFLSKFNIENQ